MKKFIIIFFFLILYSVPVYADDLPEVVQKNNAIDMYRNKIGVIPLENSLSKLNELKNTTYPAPVITFNLHDFNSSFNDKQLVLCDFSALEEYRYLGLTLLDYFRMLISATFYISAGFYAMKKLNNGGVVDA